MPYKHSGDPAWESADGDPEGYGDPEPIDERDTPYHHQLARWDWESPNHGRVDNPPVVGVPWWKDFEREAQDMATVTIPTIPAGELILVEVHGLPDDSTNPSFTYRATYDVTPGQQVQVPAPDWSIRVTGRADLPGFVLGRSDEQEVAGLRNIIPQPASPASTSIKELVDRWKKEARHFDSLVEYHEREADLAQERVHELHRRLAEIQHAAGI